MDLDDPVEVYSLKDANVAEIIMQALLDEGIPCRLDGEHQAGLTGIFDVKVLVRAADEQRAREMIESHIHEHDQEQEEFDDDEVDEGEEE